MKSKEKYILETVVCSARSGVDSRLERLLDSRQALRRRVDGCVRSWSCRSLDGQGMFLVQAIYVNKKSWEEASRKVEKVLDPHDGGIEALLSGPPLIGLFSIDPLHIEKMEI